MKSKCSFHDRGLEEDGGSLRNVLGGYIRIMKLYRNIMDHRFKRTGVYRSQHRILVAISEHTNVSQKELAKQLYVSTATIAVSVKKLEKGGYITRIVNQDDNRLNKLCLTEKGKAMVRQSNEFFNGVEEQMFCGFSKDELAVMEQYMDRICENLAHISVESDMTERKD